MRLLGAEDLDEALARAPDAAVRWAALSPQARDALQRRVGDAADRTEEAAAIVRELQAAQ